MGKNVGRFAYTGLQKIALLCAVIAGVGAAGLYVVHRYTKAKRVEAMTEQLISVARERELELLTFIDDQKIKITDLASLPEVAEALEQSLPATKATQEMRNKHKDFFVHYQKMYGYKDIFLISPAAEIIFSLHNEKIVGARLTQQPYQTTSLARSYNRAVMTMTTDLSEFEFFVPLNQAALFLCTPMVKNKKLVGVLAVQLNDQTMSAVAHNYKDLGRTGEILLAVKRGNGVQLVLPTRNEQAAVLTQLFSLNGEEGFALQKSVLGERGEGVGLDYRRQKALSVWRYLPDFAWGLVAQMDFAEVVLPAMLYNRYAYIAAFLALVSLLLSLFLAVRAAMSKFLRVQRARKNAVIALLFCNAFLTGALVYRYKNLQTITDQKIRREAQDKVQQAKQNIMAKLEHLEAKAQAIADDVGAGRLKKEDLKIRLTRDMQEDPNLLGLIIAYEPFVYNAQKKLYAPSLVRSAKGLEYQTIESFYDYTQPERPGQSITRWYSVPVHQGAQWLEPYIEPVSNILAAVYSVPFFDAADLQKKKPLGVVTVMYPLEKIKEVVEDLGIGKTGYGFIISRTGYFLYHPVIEYVQKQKTVFEIADSLNNAALRTVGEKAVRGQKGFANYRNEITAQSSSVYYEPLPGTGWSVGITFIEDEIPVDAQVWRHYQIGIVITLVMLLLLLVLLFTKAYAGTRLGVYAGVCSLIFAGGILALWALAYQASSGGKAPGVEVVDKVGLNKFLDGLNRRSVESHEAASITIPTGIYIRSLSFSNPMQIEFAADIWQQYDEKKHAGLSRGVVFPQAVKVAVTEMYREKSGDVETIGWNVQGVLSQKFEYARYPFDGKNIEIVVDHKDKIQNVLLVPDFESYRLLNPTTKPGIDREVKVAGFAVKKSMYRFRTEQPKVDFGIDATQASGTSLTFNVVLQRNLVDAVTVFLVPLLVILVALFAISWLTLENPPTTAFRPLSVYTAVTFALVILHRALRDKLPGGEVVYFEYFFFFTYITLLILIANMVVQYSNLVVQERAKNLARLLRFLYWPLELLAWFITTVIIFYN